MYLNDYLLKCAIATLDAARARTRAKEADKALAKGENWGALHGVPVTIKDTFETAELRKSGISTKYGKIQYCFNRSRSLYC